MCRMLAITNFNFVTHRGLLEDFYKLAGCGQVPPKNPSGHLDGWGIGYYSKGRPRVVKSGGSVITERKRFFGALKQIGHSRVLIAHFRKSAWESTTLKKNSHPFNFKNYIFAHNGTIYDYKGLLEFIPKKYRPRPGALDTEVFFRYLLPGYPKTFRTSVKKLARLSGYSAMNFLMSDGKKLYAYRRSTKWPSYYTLFSAKAKDSIIIASEKLSGELDWTSIARGKLRCYN